LKDEKDWKEHDATELVKKMEPGALKDATKGILIDQGDCDTFYKTQLHPERFFDAVEANTPNFIRYNIRDGYDHSYWFISTFMRDHIGFHAEAL
jgi:S-formylglutathione hydrolase FrmB